MTPLSALLIQIEGATGPDRELDVAIWLALCWESLSREIHRGTPFTGSIDAAVALVEKKLPKSDWDLDRTIMEDGAPQFGCRIFVAGKLGNHAGEAVTAPLALLSALLRTLIAQEKDNG